MYPMYDRDNIACIIWVKCVDAALLIFGPDRHSSRDRCHRLIPMTNQYLKGNFLIGTDVKWRKIFYFGLYSPRVLMTKYVVGWAGLMMDRPYLVVFSWLVQTDSFDSFPELTIISIQFIFITDANIPWHASDMKLQNRSNGESNLTMMHKWNESKQMMNFTLNTMNNFIYDGV